MPVFLCLRMGVHARGSPHLDASGACRFVYRCLLPSKIQLATDEIDSSGLDNQSECSRLRKEFDGQNRPRS